MKNEGTTLKPRTARTMIILSLVLSGLSIHAENHEPRERGLEALLEPTIGKGVRVPAAPKLPPPTDNSQIKVTLDWEKCSGDKQVGRFGIQAYRPESGWNNLTRTGCRDSFVLLSVDGKLYHFGLSYNEGLSTAGWDQPRVNKKGNRMESTWVVNIPRPSGLQSFPVA